MKLPLARIVGFLSAEVSLGGINPAGCATGYSIDSRTIRPGELFFAVKGEKMDGHDFVQQAMQKGAVAAVVAHEKLSEVVSSVAPAHPRSELPLIAVEDTLVA